MGTHREVFRFVFQLSNEKSDKKTPWIGFFF